MQIVVIFGVWERNCEDGLVKLSQVLHVQS